MKTVITRARLINGDGISDAADMAIVIDGDRIAAVHEGAPDQAIIDAADEVIDAAGAIVFPGVINTHAHRVSLAPSGAYGAPAKTEEEVAAIIERHLLQGTTTLLSVDGFATASDIARAQRLTPVNIKRATIAYPSAFEAADLSDGKGLTEEHRALTAEQAVREGAVAVGECGAGGTLGGGSQDWLYIPAAVKRETGRDIEPIMARGLKYAVLGRQISRENYDEAALVDALAAAGLDDVLSVEQARKLVEDSALPQFAVALKGLGDGAEVAHRVGVPAILHCAKASKETIERVSRSHQVIAGHANHSSFVDDEEAVEFARLIKSRGGYVDICTLDSFDGHRLNLSPSRIFALLGSGLVDTISTDYAGGHHDAIVLGIERAVAAGVISLAAAVRLATLNPATIIPGVAPDRGLIAVGKVADIVISEPDRLSAVREVFIAGTKVVDEGRVLRG